MEFSVYDSADHMWIGVVMQCNDILCERTEMLSLDGGMKVSQRVSS
jgi:hypothetical protein